MDNYYTQEELSDMVDKILIWAKKTNVKFSPIVFEGIKDYYLENQYFTDNQIKAIKNVYFKWNVDRWV